MYKFLISRYKKFLSENLGASSALLVAFGEPPLQCGAGTRIRAEIRPTRNMIALRFLYAKRKIHYARFMRGTRAKCPNSPNARITDMGRNVCKTAPRAESMPEGFV